MSDPRAAAPRPLSPLLRARIEAAGLLDLLDRVEAGQRLSTDDAMRLFDAPLDAVGALANRVRERLHGDVCFYNRNLHINATNVCEASCIFCSFARLETGDPQAWTMSMDQAVGRVRALSDVLLTEVHIVNGLNPDLPFDYYTNLMKRLHQERPDLHLKGFTAVEIHYYAEKYGMSYQDVLRAFVDAGLGSMPGGGAEIFADRARKKLCHDKVDADGWLEVHRVAHRMGIHTNCTMLYGSIETIEERVDHFVRLRQLQDESLALPSGGGAFQTFIALRFHNENNRLERLRAPTHVDSLRTLAVARLMLDNIPHIKAYWPMLGEDTAQLALQQGADDLDGTVREEHIYHMAGASTPQGLARADLLRLIEEAGRRPVERDTLYRVVSGHDWRGPTPDVAPPTPRIGAVGYRNAWPLTRFLDREGAAELREGHPADVARWLAAGQVDLALLPVGALLDDPSLRIVPDVCIGCDGPVESVLLVAEQPPEQWRRVVLDGVSRTSVLLARLLLTRGPLADRVRDDLEIVHGEPGGGVEAARGDVAAVVIGDVARALPDRLAQRLDLGSLWKQWTGLPFVFAVWAGRADLHPQVVERVRQAGLFGLSAVRGEGAGLSDNAADAAGSIVDPALAELDAEDLRYLRDAIRYPLDDAAMMGLRRFAALAARDGLVQSDQLSLYEPPADLPRQHQDRVAELLARGAAGQQLSGPDLVLLHDHAPASELFAAAAANVVDTAVPYRTGPLSGRLLDLDQLDADGFSSLADGDAPTLVRRPGQTAARWLRAVALVRLGLPRDQPLAVDVVSAGLAAASVALFAGASSFGAVDLDRLQVEGCATAEEGLVELERAVEQAGRTPVRLGEDGPTPRAALSEASKYRPLRTAAGSTATGPDGTPSTTTS